MSHHAPRAGLPQFANNILNKQYFWLYKHHFAYQINNTSADIYINYYFNLFVFRYLTEGAFL